MTTFTANTDYTGRFITDADSTFTVRVTRVTAKSVWFVHPHTHEIARAKIQNHGDGNYFFPFGRYSMAPVVRA